jgi:predicted membrane-bound mannosyltransferase
MLIHALAGLQAGIVGVSWMFACFVVAAFWGGGGIWSVPNLFSTVFYGENAWQNEFFRTTWAGIALIVVLYGLIGIVWGCFLRDHRRPLLSFYGLLAGLATYLVFFGYVWAHVNPLIPLYAPVRELLVAHVLFGAALAKSPGYSVRIARAISPLAGSGSKRQASDQETAEIVSGELIR